LAAQADLELARLQVTQKIIESFGDWYLAYTKVRVTQVNLVALEQKMGLITSRIEQGLAAPVDRVFVVGRLEQLRSDLLSLQSQQRVAHTKLNQALGRSVPLAELERHVVIPAREESFSDADIIDLSRQHPSVLRAQAQMKIQESEIAVAKADLQPDVYLKVDRQYGNYIYENLAPQNHTFVGFNTRFGPGLSNRSIIASALAKLDAAKQDQEQSQRVMFEQLSNDLTLAQAMPTRLRALYAAMTAAQETLVSWERQYLVARKNWQDIINAHRELQAASYAFHEAHVTWFVASWRLRIHAAGLENSFSSTSQTTLCNP
jgi:adhesin transport system outer membrane protein